MKRLDELRRELNIIENFPCLSYECIEHCREYYEHEIEAIEKYGAPNNEVREIKNN